MPLTTHIESPSHERFGLGRQLARQAASECISRMGSVMPAVTSMPIITVISVVSGIAKNETERRTIKIWG